MDRHHLVFAAAFPDDAIFSDEGDILVPAGRELAHAVVAALNQRQFRCSEVAQREYYGWEFRFSYRHTSITAVLQRIDKWILTLESRSSLIGILSCKPACPAEKIAENVAQALSDDLQCDDIIFCSDHDRPY
jgi:hypothetical protein